MMQSPTFALSVIGCGVLALVAAACLMLFAPTGDHEISRRIASLTSAATLRQNTSSRFLTVPLMLAGKLGNLTRAWILSARDAEALAKTLAASGLEPSKAIPIFIGAKIVSLIGVPSVVYLGAVLLGYSGGKQALYAGLSLVVAMMLPNWVIAFVRRPYQNALRRGIPDALDLMVVCAEAGLGLESAVQRVAQEMKQSNRPVSVEFLLLTNEMRIMPDRRIALSNMAGRTGQPALKRLAGTIAQTMKYGTPLSQGLRTLASEMRNERMIQFEERAGRLPALLVLPMIMFILPCLFVILMGKPASEIAATFAGMH